jgi:hypothetical protein
MLGSCCRITGLARSIQSWKSVGLLTRLDCSRFNGDSTIAMAFGRKSIFPAPVSDRTTLSGPKTAAQPENHEELPHRVKGSTEEHMSIAHLLFLEV